MSMSELQVQKRFAPPPMNRNDQMFLRMYREDARLQQGGKCAYCHEPIKRAEATGDHVKPRYQGGATTRGNIKAACEPCNLTKKSMSEAQFLKRIKNPQPGDSLHIWMAFARRRIWLATERTCTRITRMVE